ncbi:MAG: delta-60 repeat domain-containing protein [Limisphaerales bacterium]
MIVINPDGIRDTNFNSANRSLNNANTVAAVAVGESNKLYVAGTFTSYGATNVGKYMRLLPDGTFDPTFYSEAPANNGFTHMVYDTRGYLHMMRNSSSGAFQGQSFGFGPYRVFAGTNAATATATFDSWKTQFSFPSGQSDPEDDADGDGLKNVFEYYFASNPTNAASGAQPTATSVDVGGQDYPAITFIRSKSATGVTLIPQVSSNVQFSNSLGSTIASVVDLGNGTERVTIRSNVSMASQTAQFLRIQLSVP